MRKATISFLAYDDCLDESNGMDLSSEQVSILLMALAYAVSHDPRSTSALSNLYHELSHSAVGTTQDA